MQKMTSCVVFCFFIPVRLPTAAWLSVASIQRCRSISNLSKRQPCSTISASVGAMPPPSSVWVNLPISSMDRLADACCANSVSSAMPVSASGIPAPDCQVLSPRP